MLFILNYIKYDYLLYFKLGIDKMIIDLQLQ